MDKKDVKALRTKELSQMSVQELKDYVKKAEGKGFSISKSKDLGKAVDLIKVQEPKGYSQKQVESAKTSLQTKSEIPTLQRLGIAIPDWKKQQAGMAVTGAETTSPTMSDGGITGIGSSMKTDASGIPTYQDSSELKAVQAEYNKKKLEADKAANIIDDNPFFSEATRLGRQGKLNEQKARDLGTLQDKINSLKADDLLKYNVSMDRYKLQQQQVKDNLDRLNTYISTGAILNATSKDLAQIGVATGISQSMLQGIVSKTRAEIAAKNAPKTTLKVFENDAGDQTVVVLDDLTGRSIAQNTISGVGKKAKTGMVDDINAMISDAVEEANYTVNGKPTIHSDRYQSIRQAYSNYGIGDYYAFDKRYQQYVNPDYKDNYNLFAGKDKTKSIDISGLEIVDDTN